MKSAFGPRPAETNNHYCMVLYIDIYIVLLMV